MEEDVRYTIGLTEDELDDLLGMREYEEELVDKGGELTNPLAAPSAATTTQLVIITVITTATIAACVTIIEASSPSPLPPTPMPTAGSIVLTPQDYFYSLALSALTGGTTTALALLLLWGPKVADMREEISSTSEAATLEGKLTLKQMKVLAKKRGVRAGKMGKKELARKVVEEKRRMGWRGRLPFY
ncbi:hypothetical protein TrRE_jg4817 [Triparma retinervis]|uniref:Uncharacterized protein n=1 Tax=Triparma retinervis TaxID=2557542 RepID=A0A9W7CGA1_9STRA|nr:hypothetical protein TrRE_jg4817 [Triparma retinervis]